MVERPAYTTSPSVQAEQFHEILCFEEGASSFISCLLITKQPNSENAFSITDFSQFF